MLSQEGEKKNIIQFSICFESFLSNQTKGLTCASSSKPSSCHQWRASCAWNHEKFLARKQKKIHERKEDRRRRRTRVQGSYPSLLSGEDTHGHGFGALYCPLLIYRCIKPYISLRVYSSFTTILLPIYFCFAYFYLFILLDFS